MAPGCSTSCHPYRTHAEGFGSRSSAAVHRHLNHWCAGNFNYSCNLLLSSRKTLYWLQQLFKLTCPTNNFGATARLMRTLTKLNASCSEQPRRVGWHPLLAPLQSFFFLLTLWPSRYWCLSVVPGFLPLPTAGTASKLSQKEQQHKGFQHGMAVLAGGAWGSCPL